MRTSTRADASHGFKNPTQERQRFFEVPTHFFTSTIAPYKTFPFPLREKEKCRPILCVSQPCGRFDELHQLPCPIVPISADSPHSPTGRYSADKLVWVELDADKTRGTIGLSKHRVHEFGELLLFNPGQQEPGSQLDAGDYIATVEGTGVASEIETPIACRIDSVNSAAVDDAEIIGQEPENSNDGGGWLVKVTVGKQGAGEFDGLSTNGEMEEGG